MPGEVLTSIIPRSIRLAEAPSYGQVIAEYDPDSRGATAYEALATEVLERLGWPSQGPLAAPETTIALAGISTEGGHFDGNNFGASQP